MMSRQDYTVLADAIKKAYDPDHTIGTGLYREFYEAGVSLTAQRIANALALDNPRFDPQKFLTACGYYIKKGRGEQSG